MDNGEGADAVIYGTILSEGRSDDGESFYTVACPTCGGEVTVTAYQSPTCACGLEWNVTVTAYGEQHHKEPTT